jgi:outer membrane protein assembly factor BamB
VSADNHVLYMMGTGLTVASDVRTGAALWTVHYPIGFGAPYISDTVMVIGDTVVAQSVWSYVAVVAYDASTGAQLRTSRYKPPDEMVAAAAVASADERVL